MMNYFIAVMFFDINFHHNDTFYFSDEFQSQCWIFIPIMKELKNLDKLQHIWLYLSQWWIFIIIMYFHHSEKLSPKCWILITKISLNQLINFHQNDVFSSSSKLTKFINDEFSSQWCIFETMIDFLLIDKFSLQL